MTQSKHAVTGAQALGDWLTLADRCEKATGPDRRLDVEIAVAVDWRWDDWEPDEATARAMAEKHGIDWLAGRAKEGISSMWRHMPRYTASLDAAMTLVPDGWTAWELRSRRRMTAFVAEISRECDDDEEAKQGHAATPALALCAAALRARGEPS